MSVDAQTRVEFTVDASSNSRELRAYIYELRDFLQQVNARAGTAYEAVLRDTSQLFHEKTGYLNTASAPKNIQEWLERTRSLAEAIRDAKYEVEPPIHGEELYYHALRQFVFAIARDDDPAWLHKKGFSSPEDIDDRSLQLLFDCYVRDLPRSSPFRALPEFQNYLLARMDCGEKTYHHFLENFTPHEGAERTLSIFVSADLEARKGAVGIATRINRTLDSNHQVSVVETHQCKEWIEGLVKKVKKNHPECADIPFQPRLSKPASHAKAIEQRRAQSTSSSPRR